MRGHKALDALAAYSRATHRAGGPVEAADPAQLPAFRAVFCIDEREESFRRHIDEVDPACGTFGVAGFFGAAMYHPA